MTLRLYNPGVKVDSGMYAGEGPKHPAASEFIERLMRIAGTDSVPDFAARTAQPERYVYRWRAGSAAPNFINTVEMLERLGLLRWTDKVPLTNDQEATRARLLDQARDALDRLRDLG